VSTIEDNNTILIYRVGPVLCCAPCISVISITHPAPLTKLPGQKSRHSGIFKFGSNLINVCELRENFGVVPEQWREPGRIIITELSSGYIGFWVDEIIDVMKSPAKGWGMPPPLIPKATFSKTLTYSDKIHLYAEFETLYAIKQVGYLKSYIEHLNKIKIDVKEKNNSSNTNIIDKKEVPNVNENKFNKTTGSSKEIKSTQQSSEINSEPEKLQNSIPESGTEKSDSFKTNSSTITKKILPNSGLAKNKITTSVNVTKKTKENLKTTDAKRSTIKHKNKEEKSTVNKKSTISIKTDNRNATLLTNSTLVSTGKSVDESLQNKNSISESIDSYHINNENKNSLTGFFFTIILLLILFGGGYVYFLYDNSIIETKYTSNNPSDNSQLVVNENSTNKKNLKNATDNTNIAVSDETGSKSSILKSSNSKLLNKTHQSNEIDTTNYDEANKENKIALNNITKIQFIEKNEFSTILDKTNYSANISKKTDEITITVHTPVSNKKFTSLMKKTEPVMNDANDIFSSSKNIRDTKPSKTKAQNTIQNSKIVTKVTVPTESTVHRKEKKKTEYKINISKNKNNAPSTITKEIIHIVVKGDTLWHIAKFYVDNPYRYPELARLSNIKNPNLIYPGNRVHIIQIFTSGDIDNE